VILNRVTKTWN